MSWWRLRKPSAAESESDEAVEPTEAVRVLVIGKAKTGTTYLSKVLQHSLAPCEYVLEPKGAEFIHELFDGCDVRDGNVVVKIIYEHWDPRPNLRRALLANELPLRFDRKVLIIRDPRDELISRLLYIVKPLKDQQRLDADKLERWLDLLRRKEADPSAIPVARLVDSLDDIFGTRFLRSFERDMQGFLEFFEALPRGIFVMKYEDVIDARLGRLQRYLGFDLDVEVEADEAILRTRRSGAHGNWKQAFTESDREVLEPPMQPFLEAAGYNGGDLTPVDHLEPRDWSEFVAGLAER